MYYENYNQPCQPISIPVDDTENQGFSPLVSYTIEATASESPTQVQRNKKKKDSFLHNEASSTNINPKDVKPIPQPRLNGEEFTVPGL